MKINKINILQLIISSMTKKFYCFLLLLTIVFFGLYQYHLNGFNTEDEIRPRIKTPVNLESIPDIQCHYVKKIGHLIPDFEKFNIPKSKTIFFIETSCKGFLTVREVCAVESAARSNLDWTVFILFLSPVSNKVFKVGTMSLLRRYRNIAVAKVDISKYANNTPLETFINNRIIMQSTFPIWHTSDILRYLTLYKHGGIYLDLDVIVTKSFNSLPQNFAGKEDYVTIGSSILGIASNEYGKKFALDLLNQLVSGFRGDLWRRNGPDVITNVLRQKCANTYIPHNALSTNCQGFEVFNATVFYPYSWQEHKLLFRPGDLRLNNQTCTYHIWNRLSGYLSVQPDSPYAKLAGSYCPITYQAFTEQFGSLDY